MRTDAEPPLGLGVILLAAGASSRMGQPKLLLPWGPTSILGHLIEQWKNLAAEQIAVVCAARDQAVNAELDRLAFPEEDRISNPAPERGMFSSIQCAASWAGWRKGLTHWLIVLGDQPHLKPETLRALIEFAAHCPAKVCQPSRAGRPRHPVVLPEPVFTQLPQAPMDDLKTFLQRTSAGTALRELDDPGLDFDIDQPGDYEKAVQLYLKS